MPYQNVRKTLTAARAAWCRTGVRWRSWWPSQLIMIGWPKVRAKHLLRERGNKNSEPTPDTTQEWFHKMEEAHEALRSVTLLHHPRRGHRGCPGGDRIDGGRRGLVTRVAGDE